MSRPDSLDLDIGREAPLTRLSNGYREGDAISGSDDGDRDQGRHDDPEEPRSRRRRTPYSVQRPLRTPDQNPEDLAMTLDGLRKVIDLLQRPHHHLGSFDTLILEALKTFLSMRRMLEKEYIWLDFNLNCSPPEPTATRQMIVDIQKALEACEKSWGEVMGRLGIVQYELDVVVNQNETFRRLCRDLQRQLERDIGRSGGPTLESPQNEGRHRMLDRDYLSPSHRHQARPTTASTQNQPRARPSSFPTYALRRTGHRRPSPYPQARVREQPQSSAVSIEDGVEAASDFSGDYALQSIGFEPDRRRTQHQPSTALSRNAFQTTSPSSKDPILPSTVYGLPSPHPPLAERKQRRPNTEPVQEKLSTFALSPGGHKPLTSLYWSPADRKHLQQNRPSVQLQLSASESSSKDDAPWGTEDWPRRYPNRSEANIEPVPRVYPSSVSTPDLSQHAPSRQKERSPVPVKSLLPDTRPRDSPTSGLFASQDKMKASSGAIQSNGHHEFYIGDLLHAQQYNPERKADRASDGSQPRAYYEIYNEALQAAEKHRAEGVRATQDSYIAPPDEQEDVATRARTSRRSITFMDEKQGREHARGSSSPPLPCEHTRTISPCASRPRKDSQDEIVGFQTILQTPPPRSSGLSAEEEHTTRLQIEGLNSSWRNKSHTFTPGNLPIRQGPTPDAFLRKRAKRYEKDGVLLGMERLAWDLCKPPLGRLHLASPERRFIVRPGTLGERAKERFRSLGERLERGLLGRRGR